jgi:protein-L-isoaspartate(D-aspartate) O-methyltransferase
MAIMLEMLDLQPGQSVLEIGAATGYNAALIGAVVGSQGKVVTIDIQEDLVESARQHLDAAGFDWVKAVAADGGYGYPEWAPFDRIILTVCPWVIAPAWREQLKEGGRLVLPLDLDHLQHIVSFILRGDELVSTAISECGFMPIQGEYAQRRKGARTQVGSDPRLVITSDQERPEAAESVARWLAEPVRDYPSGVMVTRQEVALGLLPWWPAPGPEDLQEQEYFGLLAEGDISDLNGVPALLGYGGQWKGFFTGVALDTEGFAALVRSPGEAVPLMEYDRPNQDNQPFEIYVRQFGPGQEAAQKLLNHVWRWDQAGKPDLHHISIRAVPAGQPVTLAEGEQLWERPWTNLVIRYL